MKTYWIVDGSYALASKGGKMEITSGNELSGREFSILATGCDLPAGPSVIGSERNNTVVVDVSMGQIVFTQWRFLRRIKYCSHCGHPVHEED